MVKLADSSSPLTNAEYYAQFIYDKYLRRQLIATGFEIVNEAAKEDIDSDAMSQIETAEKNSLTSPISAKLKAVFRILLPP